MRTIEHVIDIPASPTTVWQVLTETDRYDEWNPFMTELSGEPAVGRRLRVTIRPGRRSMTFRPTVLAIEEGRLIRWRGRPGVPGIFDGEHELRLEANPDGGTRFVQREVFTGMLVPLARRVLDDTELGFADMDAALRDRAVSGPAGPVRPRPEARVHGRGSRTPRRLIPILIGRRGAAPGRRTPG